MCKSLGVISICIVATLAAVIATPIATASATAPAAPDRAESSGPAASSAADDGSGRGGSPALSDLAVRRQGAQWTASVRLNGGLTPDMQERIEAGLETTIEYRFQVCRRRSFLPDQVLVKRRVECAVRYDALTQQYTLTRRVDGELQETKVTDDRGVMTGFLTALREEPLLPASEITEGQEYYVKAKSSFGLIWRFYLIPWALDTGWVRMPLQGSEGDALATRP
jgi:hypothetical protein